MKIFSTPKSEIPILQNSTRLPDVQIRTLAFCTNFVTPKPIKLRSRGSKLYQKAKSLIFKAPPDCLSFRWKDVNHDNSTALQTRSSKPGAHKKPPYILDIAVKIRTLALDTNSIVSKLIELHSHLGLARKNSPSCSKLPNHLITSASASSGLVLYSDAKDDKRR
ncbi:hypothetical protein M9H77_29028 [Catharanthus roseus]|uniref:Uncharacterized protein n=1 Tax=Catharanthus roseus TaxID=4058 RepID=A0ACC0AH97_CATRO|nr:hypothetical protein M9H77_29028 [Catharanthus roseus]